MTTAAHAHQPQVDVYEPTAEQWRHARERALGELGVTYEELEEQARTRNFESVNAHNAWVIFGNAQR